MLLEEFYKYQNEGLPFGNPPILKEDIFQIHHYDEEPEIIDSCKFYKEAIEHNSYYLRTVCNVVFHADYKINARAAVFEGKGMIVWYSGLLFKQLNILKEDEKARIEEAFSDTEISLTGLFDFFDTDISRLCYQINQHFTFYHEFAHIIQQQGQADNEQHKYQEEVVEFDSVKHLLEIDADNFAALCLVAHITQYADKIFPEGWGRNEISILLAFYLVPILVYSMELQVEKLEEMDLFTGTHPHPMARLMLIIITFVEYFNQQERGFKLAIGEVFDPTLEVAAKLSDVDYEKLWIDHEGKFQEYYKWALSVDFPINYQSAVTEWNETIQRD